jgi:glutamate-1-semialdehyde 2,1-aminomutase
VSEERVAEPDRGPAEDGTETGTGHVPGRSEELFAEAARHLVGGVGSGTRSPRSGWQPCPVFVASARGAHVTDVDGRGYIDYAMGLGPLILGHRPPAVIEAVTRVINERGSMFALAHDLEGQAAAAVAGRIPSMELLRFGNSGTECCHYAIRFARAFTGRQFVVRFEGHYHGWSDVIHWSAHPALDAAGPEAAPAVVPETTGMTAGAASGLIVLGWNDAAALERVFAERGDEIAAVITEPIDGNAGAIMPEPGYLETMRLLTERHGALLIFDEVLTGFRVHRAGAQGLFGVTPDLTVLAKALGGGFPVAAFGGRGDVMEMAADGRTMHGGTYNSSPLVCAAALATLAETGKPGFYEYLGELGSRLRDGLLAAADDAGLPACWSGPPQMGQLWFSARPPRTYREAIRIAAGSPYFTFYRELRERGVLIQPPQEGLLFVSGGHTAADIERTVEVAWEAMPAVARAAAEGRVGPRGGVR